MTFKDGSLPAVASGFIDCRNSTDLASAVLRSGHVSRTWYRGDVITWDRRGQYSSYARRERRGRARRNLRGPTAKEPFLFPTYFGLLDRSLISPAWTLHPRKPRPVKIKLSHSPVPVATRGKYKVSRAQRTQGVMMAFLTAYKTISAVLCSPSFCIRLVRCVSIV